MQSLFQVWPGQCQQAYQPCSRLPAFTDPTDCFKAASLAPLWPCSQQRPERPLICLHRGPLRHCEGGSSLWGLNPDPPLPNRFLAGLGSLSLSETLPLSPTIPCPLVLWLLKAAGYTVFVEIGQPGLQPRQVNLPFLSLLICTMLKT